MALNWLTLAPLNQLAAAWRDHQLGSCATATIGSDGCVVTDFAMLAGVTPLTMNEAMVSGGWFYQGCLARTFDVQRMGFASAPPLMGVTLAYQRVAFPAPELARVWGHVRAGGVAMACVDADPKTAKFEQHWVLLVASFGHPSAHRDFVIADPNGGLQTNFTQRYGALARALVRVAMYGGGALTREFGQTDARQEARASLKEVRSDK